MKTVTSFESSHFRSRLFCNGVITVALAAILALGSVKPQPGKGKVPQIKRAVSTWFGRVKQIHGGHLDVRSAEARPADGPVVILLHAWPSSDRSASVWLRFLPNSGDSI